MVGTALRTRPNGDRAQLILIGAISIAFILLGVVVVFNGVQYTETVSSGETGETLTNAETTDRELEAGIAGLVEHYEPSPGSDLDDEIETYIKDHYQPTKASHRPVSISVDDIDIIGIIADGSSIDVSVTYTYTTNTGEITRTIDVTATVRGAV